MNQFHSNGHHLKMKLRDFDLNLLIAFDALMKEGNVSRAAERMFITQSAMSHALNRLRDLLDDPVLVRTSEGMKPTPRAKSMSAQVCEVLRDIQQILGQPEHFEPATSKRQFVIEGADYMEYMLLPPLMGRIYHNAPRVDIQIKKPETNFPKKDMENGNTDILLGFDKNLEVPSQFIKEILFEDERVCLVRKDHPLVKRKLTLQQYLEMDHMRVSPTGNKFGAIDQALSVQGLKRRIALMVPHFLYAPHILTTTDMILSPPLRIAEQFTRISPLKVLPLPLKLPPYKICMVWSPIREKDRAHIWLRTQIQNIGKEIAANI